MTCNFIVFFVFSLVITSCTIDDSFDCTVSNQSDKKVYVALQTGLDNNLNGFQDPAAIAYYQIDAMMINNYIGYENDFAEGNKLSVIFVTETVFNSNSWKELLDNELFAKRVNLSFNELANTGCNIAYP